jgi:hypothetical protein
LRLHRNTDQRAIGAEKLIDLFAHEIKFTRDSTET